MHCDLDNTYKNADTFTLVVSSKELNKNKLFLFNKALLASSISSTINLFSAKI